MRLLSQSSGSVALTVFLAAVANFYLTFSIIITIVAASLRRPDQIDGGSAAEKACWGGSFVDASSNPDSFDWLGEIKCATPLLSVDARADSSSVQLGVQGHLQVFR